ncbi:hypothetical protein EJ05DRAFT_499119 [Pseudovirgaria hyperparasitica]|uniref:EthD domain-containing protein n=1 Tax=Pseudovirgaria hyperparasitica TaxID=470096 RepID=A0A6A6WAP1_9PEZI|nr:uncharacterized protein EJ05DRAFT_499119 [Pseudovirgaria hyperparasitica]KAF2759928.1 hypothetical protein EJ05DRAFT_499119 [Pseudovirgaria hyperparasitica]
MTFTVLALENRNPSISFEEFQTHWDEKFLPFFKSIVGDTFPVSHTRYYVKQDVPTGQNQQQDNQTSSVRNPMTFMGAPSECDFDCVVVLVFRDEEHFTLFRNRLGDNVDKLAPEQEKFLIGSELRVFGVENEKTVRG